MKAQQIFFFLMIIFMAGCHNFRSWTDEERKDFRLKCQQTDTFNNYSFYLAGFEFDEIDTIIVKEYKDTVFIDSFRIFPSNSQSPDEKRRKIFVASISNTLNIKHRYQFIISGQKPYELSNMKMTMWPTYSQDQECYDCRMADYTIDGVIYQGYGNLTIAKRDK